MYKFAVVCLVALLGSTIINASEEETRIVNGQVVDISSVPYIVQLRDSAGRQFCGGSMVTPQIVVTAAHCFDGTNYQSVTVVAGVNRVSEIGVHRRIAAFYKPPTYTSRNFHMDVAVLKLDAPMVGPNIATISLCSQPMMQSQLVQVSGWGKTTDGGAGSQELRSVMLPLLSGQDCQARTANTGIPIGETMICTLGGSQDACHGDSGGPAVYNDELCGIVSWGQRCASGTPTIFTNVFGLRDFIIGIVRSMQ